MFTSTSDRGVGDSGLRSPDSGRRRTLVIALLVVATVASLGAAASAQTGAVVSLGNATGGAGENVTVPLSVTGEDVAAYEVSVTYDGDVLQFAGASGEDFGAPVVNDDSESGVLNATQTDVDGVDDPTLAVLTFELVGDASDSTEIGFDADATALFDSDAGAIPVGDHAPGTVTVEGESGGPGAPSPDSLLSNPLVLGAGVVVLIAVVGGVAYVVGRRRSRPPRRRI